jgi:hypothetical protein
MTQAGNPDPTFAGPRVFTVGTGGRSLIGFDLPARAGTAFRDATHYGVLRLTLNQTSWTSEFDRTDGVAADRVGAGC